jgi:PAS domain S-box-containing protein
LEYVNAQATTLLGHSQDALLSMSVCDLDLDFSNQAWPEFWRERLQRGVLHFESVTRRQDGSEVPVAVSVNRLETAGQELACAIVKDISARKRAEESRIRLEQILDSSSAVIYQKNVEGRYEFANRRWGQLFDLQPRDVVGKTDYDLFPREMADAFCRNDQRVIARRQELQIQEVAPHADGPHTYISVKVPVWDTSGRIRGVAGISTDISEQLAAQEELQNSKRLAEIGKMITVLAHECRNSLQRGHACLSMLLREIQEMPKALDYANRLQQAQDDLQHVFDELRSYASRIRLEISRCNLRELIEEAWEQLADVPTHPDVSLRIMESDLDLSCDVDVFRLKQVFRIILENAIGASPTPGVISIEGSCVNLSTGPALRVTVSDQGPGFTPQQQAQAFKAFYTTKVTGTGLGLTIARRIVECHGGQIEIGGDLKTGGTVLITLPQRRVKDGCIT